MYVRTHTYMRRCLLLSIITGVLMTSDEVNSSTGKKLVIFEERRKKEVGQNLNLSSTWSLWSKSKCLNLSSIWTDPTWTIRHLNLSDLNLSSIWTYLTWTYPLLFNKGKERFLLGHDERLNLSSIWTYPTGTYLAFELIQLELIRHLNLSNLNLPGLELDCTLKIKCCSLDCCVHPFCHGL